MKEGRKDVLEGDESGAREGDVSCMLTHTHLHQRVEG